MHTIVVRKRNNVYVNGQSIFLPDAQCVHNEANFNMLFVILVFHDVIECIIFLNGFQTNIDAVDSGVVSF